MMDEGRAGVGGHDIFCEHALGAVGQDALVGGVLRDRASHEESAVVVAHDVMGDRYPRGAQREDALVGGVLHD